MTKYVAENNLRDDDHYIRHADGGPWKIDFGYNMKLRDKVLAFLNTEPIPWRQISGREGVTTIEFDTVVDDPIDGVWHFVPVASP